MALYEIGKLGKAHEVVINRLDDPKKVKMVDAIAALKLIKNSYAHQFEEQHGNYPKYFPPGIFTEHFYKTDRQAAFTDQKDRMVDYIKNHNSVYFFIGSPMDWYGMA